MDAWIAVGFVFAGLMVGAYILDRGAKPMPKPGPEVVEDDGMPTEVDCESCHGTGINDSLLVSVFHAEDDRACRDCDGTGVQVVWSR